MRKHLITATIALLLGILIGMVLQSDRKRIAGALTSAQARLSKSFALNAPWLRKASGPPHTYSEDTIARFSDGRVVQLVAVGTFRRGPAIKDTDTNWWRPDGTPIDRLPFSIGPMDFNTTAKHWFAFRTAGPGRPEIHIKADSATRQGSYFPNEVLPKMEWVTERDADNPSVMRTFSRYDPPSPTTHLITFIAEFPQKQGSTDLTTSLASETWTTETEFTKFDGKWKRSSTQRFSIVPYPTPGPSFHLHMDIPPTSSAFPAHLTWRATAHDHLGYPWVASLVGYGWGSEPGMYTSLDFYWEGLNPVNTNWITIQTRKFEDIKLRNVSLQPSLKSVPVRGTNIHLAQAPKTLAVDPSKIWASITCHFEDSSVSAGNWPLLHDVRVDAFKPGQDLSTTPVLSLLTTGGEQGQVAIRLPLGEYMLRATSGTQTVMRKEPYRIRNTPGEIATFRF